VDLLFAFSNQYGKLGQVTHGGVFLKNDFTVVFGVDFERVALADAEGAADFLRNDDTAEIIFFVQCRLLSYIVSLLILQIT